MNNEDKMFELMTKMYGEMQKGLQQVNEKTDRVENEVSSIKKVVIKIENDHGRKLDALFDGYKQNAEKLTRIEDEVSKHEEIILRKVR